MARTNNNKRKNSNPRRQDYGKANSKSQDFGNGKEEENAQSKRRGKNNPKFDGSRDSSDRISAYNDASWYSLNPQMLQDSASYSYNAAIGSPFRVDRIFGDDVAKAGATVSAVPGILSIELFPSPGVSSDKQSPINIAAQNIYSYVRYQNSGAANYDAPDLMMYLLAMDSVYMMWNFMKRAYGMISQYSQFNRYMPAAYCAASHLDYDDLVANLADFRAYINQTAAKISAFCVPAVMSYFVRHSWLFANIYKDSDTLKAQQYIFVPGIYYQFAEVASTSGTMLQAMPFTMNQPTTNPHKFADLVNVMNGMINALQYSEDAGIMSGDILKAYGESKLFRLSKVEPDFTVTPVYNEEVLTQIHNLTQVSYLSTMQPSALNITQDPDTNLITYDPVINTAGSVPSYSVLINLPWSNVTPENTMVATRLVAVLRTNSSGTGANFQVLGSEFVGHLHIWTYVSSTTNPTAPGVMDIASYRNMQLARYSFTKRIGFSTAQDANTLAAIVAIIGMISNFDWHPIVFLTSTDASGETPVERVVGLLGDINTYSIVESEELAVTTLTAIMSEFGIPQFGPVY